MLISSKERKTIGPKRFIPIILTLISISILIYFLKHKHDEYFLENIVAIYLTLISINIISIVTSIFITKKYGREIFSWVSLYLTMMTSVLESIALSIYLLI